MAPSIFSPALASPAVTVSGSAGLSAVPFFFCFSFRSLSLIAGPQPSPLPFFLARRACTGQAGHATGRLLHFEQARPAEEVVTAGDVITWHPALPAWPRSQGVCSGVLGGAFASGRKQALPRMGPGLWGSRLAVWACTCEAHGGSACGASYNHLLWPDCGRCVRSSSYISLQNRRVEAFPQFQQVSLSLNAFFTSKFCLS